MQRQYPFCAQFAYQGQQVVGINELMGNPQIFFEFRLPKKCCRRCATIVELIG
jgi:hypothetical protein